MKNKYIAAVFFCCTFIITFVFVQHFVINAVNKIRIEGLFPNGAHVHVDISNGIYAINSNKRYSIAIDPSDKKQRFDIGLSDTTMTSFRITVDDSNGNSELFTISVLSFFNPPIVFESQQFTSSFEITKHPSGSIMYTLKSPLENNNLLLLFAVTLLFSACFFLLVLKTQWQEFPAIQDYLVTQNSSNHNNFASLDGLRGLAALLVFLEHSVGFFHGVGGFGVWLFFVLSGFLLTRPFVLDHSYAIQKEKMLSFLSRRIKRIVPLFFFVITVIFLIPGDYERAFRHYLFVQGDGHFWTILQEMYFYVMLPVIGIFIYLLCKRNNFAVIALLLIVGLLWWKFGTTQIFSMYAFHHSMRGFFEVFIVGMIGAYFYFGIFLNSEKIQSFFSNHKNILSALGIVFLFSMIFISMTLSEKILGFDVHLKNQSMPSALLCLVVILLAITTKNSWYNKLLCNPFLRYVGIIGYSFYLVHPYAIFLSKHIVQHVLLVDLGNFIWLLSSLSLLITIIFASFTYTYIERPFLKQRTAFGNDSIAKQQQTS